jgi:hypothetical protein
LARLRLRDFYQNYRYHLIDVTVTRSGGIARDAALSSLTGITKVAPESAGPFTVLQPQIAFSSISHPQIDVETDEIRGGTNPFPVHFASGGKISEITLERGVHLGDQDFHDWVKLAIYGRGIYRRDLLLVQFFSEPIIPGDRSLAKLGSAMSTMTLLSTADRAGGGVEQLAQGILSASGAAVVGAAAVGVGGEVVGAISDVQAAISGRAWRLLGCIPTGYESGKGLEGTSSDITIASITIQPEFVEEFSLNGPPGQGLDGII